jgi:transposase-like protein
MTKPISRDPIYRRRRFEAETIELCVRWYIAYRLSYRDLACSQTRNFDDRVTCRLRREHRE